MKFSTWLENNQPTPNQSKIVSFDFDGVLHSSMHPGTIHPVDYENSDLDPRWDMHEKLRQEARSGHRIIVVSARCYDYPLREFIENHDLPVSNIFVTCDKSKIPILKQYNVIRHYDDNRNMEWEVDDAIDEGILHKDFEFIYVPPEQMR